MVKGTSVAAVRGEEDGSSGRLSVKEVRARE
jgi:hypothetical protein